MELHGGEVDSSSHQHNHQLTGVGFTPIITGHSDTRPNLRGFMLVTQLITLLQVTHGVELKQTPLTSAIAAGKQGRHRTSSTGWVAA